MSFLPKGTKRARRKLDEKLLMEESEQICGLEKNDGLFGLCGKEENRQIRRIEIMCQAHSIEKETAHNLLAMLESKQFSKQNSNEIKSLKMRLETLGDYPSRMERTEEDTKKMKQAAKAMAISQEVCSNTRSIDASIHASGDCSSSSSSRI